MSDTPEHVKRRWDLERRVEGQLEGHFADRLNAQHEVCGLRWSDRMNQDDPHAEFMVVDKDGNEYVMEISVTLYQSEPSP